MVNQMLEMLYGTYPMLAAGPPLMAVKRQLDIWPNGWFPILDALCRQIEEWNEPEGSGLPFFNPLYSVDGIYFDHVADPVHDALIRYANRLACETCMVCGAPGLAVSVYGIRCAQHSCGAYGESNWEYGVRHPDQEEVSDD